MTVISEQDVPTATGTSPLTAGGRQRRRQEARRPWLLLAPALVVLTVLLLWPLGRVAWLSVQDYGLRELNKGTTNYVGFSNYSEILGDPYLWSVVLPNTVGFAAACVIGTVLVGTLVGLFLNTLGPRWRFLCSSAIMVAWAVPAVTGTYVWVWLFDPLNGFVTHALDAIGLMDAGSINWFTDRLGFYSIAWLNIVHHGFPFVAVTVLAGLMTVPQELYEAATMDGANAWQRFWRITVPTLKQVFAVVTILSTIWDFKIFTQVYLMPGGDGSNPEVFNLGVWSYIESFAQSKYGMGSAIALLLTLLLLVITVVYLHTLFREEEL